MTTIDELIARIDRDHSDIYSLVSGLPQFLAGDPGDIPVTLNGVQGSIPNLKKLTAAINMAIVSSQLAALNDQMNKQSVTLKGVISDVSKLTGHGSPFWNAYNLNDPSIGDTSDPTFRANIENGLRFPFDGYVVNNLDRKDPSVFTKIGNQMLPNYTEKLIPGYPLTSGADTPSAIATGYLNIAAYPAFSQTTYYSENYWGWYGWYYGYYYYWWNYYYSYSRVYAVTTTIAINGSATAQSFQVSSDQILTGVNFWAYAASSNQSSNPYVLLCECTQGIPDPNKVIGRADPVKDANYTGGALTTAAALTPTNNIRFNFGQATYLHAGKSYAFIVVSNGTYNLWYNSNSYNKGGAFYTQDGAQFSVDLQKDLMFELVVAQFSAGQQIVELAPVSLSGGIASIKTELQAVIPAGTQLQLQVSINGNWQPLTVLNNLDSLPPYTPIRAVYTCTTDLAPIVDVVKSSVTAFRPATALNFFVKPIPIKSGSTSLNLTFNMVGFDKTMHTLDIKIKLDNGTILSPDVVRQYTDSVAQGMFDTFFTIPAGAISYQLIAKATTQVATRVFDVTSIVES
ncbi:hypothetical protein F6R98_10775 [Candidatus Methylospira mobilis]|uniref:Uncharacterized protein n=1 Tax=Candidatus Methylospira mobilis TaxID=1808979 RepID=A0A5Q0BLF3_9GAMM|nr:hypothetical protein [Candidatus Methylospira mobilis]QFY43041.1 hypothetical protein F6R98_10775 [Candidatus Methylospira mobilis]